MEPKVEVIVSEQLTTGDSSISPGDANTPAKGEQFTPVLPDENAAIGGASKDYKAEMQQLMGNQIESSPDIGTVRRRDPDIIKSGPDQGWELDSESGRRNPDIR